MVEFECKIPYCNLPASDNFYEGCEVKGCKYYKEDEDNYYNCVHMKLRTRRHCLKSYDEIEYPLSDPFDYYRETYCVIKAKGRTYRAYKLWIDGKEIELEEE